ncbi:hypothetical protein ENU1_003510 [Entamoeba nuttalli P19]|uniref:Uncharacterized protein n=1 Tax=Entamoeba nuttalli (strain P19) TaxID=1076696 RepID=K2H8M1_ENTNP|nr:hypothetical protein ENU1_003510 [Entamoeba nuttalli P19]EKE42957.1 hypothetical protein ENU1_003510 [Entamoeba nuttalli P19]|eukprot:XP_008854709.1 hypothetical protein ENU1_003510 [Entamoeba nuttalli P19]
MKLLLFSLLLCLSFAHHSHNHHSHHKHYHIEENDHKEMIKNTNNEYGFGFYINCTEMTSCIGCGLALNQCYWNVKTHQCISLPENTYPQDIYAVCPADEIALFEQQLVITIIVISTIFLLCCVCCIKCCCPSTRRHRTIRRTQRHTAPHQPVVQQPVQIPMTNYYIPPTPGTYVQPVYGLGQAF